MTGGVFLSLGSNLGDREKNLSDAIQQVGRFASVVRRSSIYVTGAWGNTNQPDFLNQVLEIETDLPPEDVLHQLLKTETRMGRTRADKWGPRIIDLDILFYRDEVIKVPNLTIPHPEIQNRKFVLIPLREIAPDFIHPIFKKSISQLDEECTDNLEVRRLPRPPQERSS